MAKLCDEGETLFGEIFLKKDTVTNLYLGLYTDSSEPGETDTLTDITEATVSGGSAPSLGYTRKQLVSAQWEEGVIKGEFTNDELTFTAQGGSWGAVYGYFITDCESGTAGKLCFVEHFSDGPYTVNDTLQIKITPKVVIT